MMERYTAKIAPGTAVLTRYTAKNVLDTAIFGWYTAQATSNIGSQLTLQV